jgi:hypothetical protein
MATLAPSQNIATQRDPNGRKFMDIVGQQYDRAGLSEEEARHINDTAGLAGLIANFIAENRANNKFKDERVSSACTYPKEYKGPNPIIDQIQAIASIFGLDPVFAIEYAKHLPQLPQGAEGWFAIPSLSALAVKRFPEVTDPAEQYCQAIQIVQEKIAASRAFYNYREGQIRPQQLLMHTRTTDAMALIAGNQKSDILIVAAQLGMRHRGRSVRCAQEKFTSEEYGLGSLAVGSIILTHPERLIYWEELDMNCAGDEFAPTAGGPFVAAPIFVFNDDKVRFDILGVIGAYGPYGSASGFLP